ncbi:MAG: translocation/assembly module TamB domain-containing protein [Acidobacteriaceae bacterium]|nr:translocation/assembly module TamB domain-containing protein [Acidobacteriaceae bacterium]MBV9778818.1 translocation/assembly module TamB domain-containing protein [Acidobacteriaceae bacterium]
MASKRTILLKTGAICGVLTLSIAAALYALRANWFKEAVREKIVSAVTRATGGRVEIGSFTYDWSNLTADFRDFAVHGTEPSDAAPLFRADTVRVQLKIVSLVKRQVDIAALIVEHPTISILVRAGGGSNVPAPQVPRHSGEFLQELLSLKVQHFEIRRGLIQFSDEQIPLSARGENLHLLVDYGAAGPQYDLRLSSRHVQIDSDQFRPRSIDVDGRAQLQKDRILFEYVRLTSGESKLDGAGTLIDFTHPSANFQVNADIPAREFVGTLPELQRGQLTLRGDLQWNEVKHFTITGKLSGLGLAYRSRALTFTGARFQSDIAGSAEELKMTHLSASALGGRLAGDATIRHLRDIRFDGDVRDLGVRELAVLALGKPVAWSGIASGPVHIKGALDPKSSNLTLQASLNIKAASGGIPVSGETNVSYKERGNVLELGSSHFDFPSSHFSISGRPGTALTIKLDSTNLYDLQPSFWLSQIGSKPAALPFTLENGTVHFDGSVIGQLTNPRIQGVLAMTRFRARGQIFDQLRSNIDVSERQLTFTSLALEQAGLRAYGDGSIGLTNWSMWNGAAFKLNLQFEGVELAKLMSAYSPVKLPVANGIASGSLTLAGTLADLHGKTDVTIHNLDAYGEPLNQLHIESILDGDRVQITHGQVQAGPAVIAFTGSYHRTGDSWKQGEAQLKVDSNGFPLASLSLIRKYEPGFNGMLEIHAASSARLYENRIAPAGGNGTIVLRGLAFNGANYGDLTVSASTHGPIMETRFSGDLSRTQIRGSAQLQLTAGTPIKGEAQLDRIDLSTFYALLNSGQMRPLAVTGFLQGGLSFEGSLAHPEQLRSTVHIDHVEVSPSVTQGTKAPVESRPEMSEFYFHNVNPIVVEAAHGVARIPSSDLVGNHTRLSISGSFPYRAQQPMAMRAQGSLDLGFLELFDPRVRSSGETQISAIIQGTLESPALTGSLQVRNGSFFLSNLQNGLTGMNGTVRFDRDRATIQQLTARSGGGELALAGFVSFAGGGPLVYRLEANAQNIRVRYAAGVSVTANSALRFTGTSNNSLLSGTVTVSRVAFNPSSDVGTLLTTVRNPVPPLDNERNLLTGLQFDIRIQSSPDLALNTALSRDLEGQMDLRLRGTPDHPVLLGDLSANQGNIKVWGTKYSINRGNVRFLDPAKIEPVLDLDLQTQTRGITVDIAITGTLSKLNVNYRSDPPLQPRDIVALLTVGRTPNIGANVPNIESRNDITALQSSANTVLGQAISPNSNRLSKLFGITNIKIDPLVQGITNTPQSRLTIEQQMSPDVTITYITNLSQTSEQIFRFEWALNRQYSLIALRDDNGEFGIDIQYKKRFK